MPASATPRCEATVPKPVTYRQSNPIPSATLAEIMSKMPGATTKRRAAKAALRRGSAMCLFLLLFLDVSRGGGRGPEPVLPLRRLQQAGGGAEIGLDPHGGEALLQRRVGEGVAECLLQPGHHRLRQAGRAIEPDPAGEVEIRHALFLRGRDIREEGRAGGGGN